MDSRIDGKWEKRLDLIQNFSRKGTIASDYKPITVYDIRQLSWWLLPDEPKGCQKEPVEQSLPSINQKIVKEEEEEQQASVGMNRLQNACDRIPQTMSMIEYVKEKSKQTN